MDETAMVIVDMQKALVDKRPYAIDQVVDVIADLAAACRETGVPVIFIQHDGGEGDELQRGSEGWRICEALSPRPEDAVVEKRFNSAFRQTELRANLEALGATRLILCGMQTEYCMDATCKVAFEFGYDVIIPKHGTTTFDNAFATGESLAKYYERMIWDGRYAVVRPADAIKAELRSGLREEERAAYGGIMRGYQDVAYGRTVNADEADESIRRAKGWR